MGATLTTTETARLALAGAREYVLQATRTGNAGQAQRATRVLALVDQALEAMRPAPPPAAAEEPWEFPEPTLRMPSSEDQ